MLEGAGWRAGFPFPPPDLKIPFSFFLIPSSVFCPPSSDKVLDIFTVLDLTSQDLEGARMRTPFYRFYYFYYYYGRGPQGSASGML
jgi:hypothetical protein